MRNLLNTTIQQLSIRVSNLPLDKRTKEIYQTITADDLITDNVDNNDNMSQLQRRDRRRDSRYCDQCGQALLYCDQCGRVGLGRRCTIAEVRMYSLDEIERMKSDNNTSLSSTLNRSLHLLPYLSGEVLMCRSNPKVPGIPQLTLYNGNLNIRIIGQNGAVIGRRQGLYQKIFENNKYVSGVHAQPMYNGTSGWCIVDKNTRRMVQWESASVETGCGDVFE